MRARIVRLIAGCGAGLLASVVAVLGTGPITASANSCPARTVCVWSGPNFTGQFQEIPAASFHSQWFSADSVVGFHITSAENNTNSSFWLHDEATEDFGAICGGGDFAASFPFQSGYFFIQYNVPQGCGGNPPSGSP